MESFSIGSPALLCFVSKGEAKHADRRNVPINQTKLTVVHALFIFVGSGSACKRFLVVTVILPLIDYRDKTLSYRRSVEVHYLIDDHQQHDRKNDD